MSCARRPGCCFRGLTEFSRCFKLLSTTLFVSSNVGAINIGMDTMSKSKILIIVLLLGLTAHAYRLSQASGLMLSLSPQEYGQCEKVTGPVGPEDITIDVDRKVAFISSSDRRHSAATGQSADGGLWTLDLSIPDSEAVQINVEIDGAFHPPGIDLLQLDGGQRELYVVNHADSLTDEIVVFELDDANGLHFKERFRFPELISPNDIRAIAPNTFFVTNDYGSPRGSLMATLESYLMLARSSVVFFDGKTAQIVAEDLRMANGIALSKDLNTLYVAETTGRQITRFKNDVKLEQWRRTDSLSVDSGVDNLEWDQDGRLLTGAHPKLFDFLGHAKQAGNLSSSQVIRIDVSQDQMTFESLYLNLGEELSGSSVAAMLDEELLVGAVFEPHFLRCGKEG